MDTLRAMRLFLRVAALGSFAAVAREADVARSVVTRQVAALERHLKTRLITRSTRHLTLTAAGVAYAEKARAVIALLESAENDVARESSVVAGRIRLSVPLSFGLSRLSPWLIDFARRHREVALEIDLTDRRVDLAEEGVDLAIRVTSRLAPGDVARRLGSAAMKTVAAPAYLSEAGRPTRPAHLARHDCLSYASESQRHAWQYTLDGRVESVPVRTRLCASNGELLADAAARGLGIAMLPDFIVDPWIESGRLEVLLTRFAPPPLGIHAVLPAVGPPPHRIRLLMDELAALISRRRDGAAAKGKSVRAPRRRGAAAVPTRSA
jgi:DNA-binding transcriptional LysR family regulator